MLGRGRPSPEDLVLVDQLKDGRGDEALLLRRFEVGGRAVSELSALHMLDLLVKVGRGVSSPDPILSHGLSALLLVRAGQPRRAARHILKAMQTEGDLPVLRALLVEVFVDMDELDGALLIAEPLLDDVTHGRGVRLRLASALQAVGRVDEARVHIDAVASSPALSAGDYAVLARLTAKKESTGFAKEAGRRGLRGVRESESLRRRARKAPKDRR
jgi:hypothetical protein